MLQSSDKPREVPYLSLWPRRGEASEAERYVKPHCLLMESKFAVVAVACFKKLMGRNLHKLLAKQELSKCCFA